jgi:hypothetical protein
MNMTSTERLEILMQRAADGELSVEQRHELMEAAEEHPDGWKQLACTILEEQLVGRTIRLTPLTATTLEATTVQPLRRPTGFWYHHPVLTTAVTICLAFVLGLAVPPKQDANNTQHSAAMQLMPDPVAAQPASQGVSRDAELHNRLSRILQMLEESDRRLPVER